MNEQLTNLLYTQAMQRYPLPQRFRALVRQIQLSATDEEAYICRIQALMHEEPELARIYALRAELVERAAGHIERGDVYEPETDSWHPPPERG